MVRETDGGGDAWRGRWMATGGSTNGNGRGIDFDSEDWENGCGVDIDDLMGQNLYYLGRHDFSCIYIGILQKI